MLGNKRRIKPNVPSSLDILSNRRPAKHLLYDPLRYGVLSSDDRYLILFVPGNDIAKGTWVLYHRIYG